MSYRILVRTTTATEYAKDPDGTVAVFDHILEAEAFAELWHVGRPGVLAVSYTREAWPLRAERLRRDLALGLPLPEAS